MISTLKKNKHKFIWIIFGILLPILFYLGYKAIQEKANSEDEVYHQTANAIGDVVDSKELKLLKITLREGEKHQRQIEVEVRKPLKAPGNMLVVKGFNFGDLYVDESLSGKGIYRFEWKDSVELAYQVQLMDRINNKELEKINLKLEDELHDHHHH